MAAPRGASLWQTVRLRQGRDKPTVKPPRVRDKPAGRRLRANGRPALVEVPPEARGVPLPVMLPPTELLARVGPLLRVSELMPPVTPLPTGLPAQVEPLLRVSEPLPPVTPPLAGLPAAEVRVPSEGAPGDTTDPGLAPPALAVLAAWDRAAAVGVVVVGVGKWGSASSCLLACG